MSFMTVLEKAGHDIVSVFKKAEPVVEELQVVATPFENMFVPGMSALVSAGLAEVAKVEALGVAADNTSGSNQVKLAAVVSTLASNSASLLEAIGVDPSKVTTAQYTNFVNGIVQASNAFQTTQEAVAPVITPVVATVTPAAIPAAPVTGAAVPPK